MKTLLPHPLLSLALAAAWLGLNEPPGATTVAAALLVGLLVPAAMAALRLKPVRVRAPATLVRFLGLVLMDSLRSNIEVAGIVLGLRRRGSPRRAGFVHVPLDLRDRYGLAALAIAVTSIPGTVWVDYDSRSGRLLLHVLDLDDADSWVSLIKQRYERPLLEIFP